MMNNSFTLGFDYLLHSEHAIKVPITADADSHLIVVGGSGSGKSTAVLYWLYKIKHTVKAELYIADFKASKEFTGITPHFAEFEDCYDLIKRFYAVFQQTPEGGDGRLRILVIDEIAGLLTHFGMSSNKEVKAKADEIRYIMSSILMLGRSRRCFLWLSMQRYTATIFPASSGSADNFHIVVGLGNLTVDGRKGLFAGEHFDGEDTLQYGRGRGIVLIDGQPLAALLIPMVSKKKLLKLLC